MLEEKSGKGKNYKRKLSPKWQDQRRGRNITKMMIRGSGLRNLSPKEVHFCSEFILRMI